MPAARVGSDSASEIDDTENQESIVQTMPWTARMQRTCAMALLILLWVGQPKAVLGQERDGRLQGEFAVTIAAEDIPPEQIDGASLIGRWHITFNEDGTYALGRQDVGALVSGQFETGEDQLTLRAETGVLACGSGPDDDAAASYEWEITGGQLRLVAIDEPCARRRLLLTTRTLATFAACPPQTPESSATPGIGFPVSEPTDAPNGSAALATRLPRSGPDSDIDTLLKQMSDCWATRQPDRFLQLLSQDFQASQRPEGDDAVRRFTLTMGAPIVWELASEVELVDATHATATVRQTLGDTIDTVHYAFVLEDGAWRWDGTVDSP